MNILVIGTRFAPIPGVEGGAIEVLANEYIKYNSENRQINITVYSSCTQDIDKDMLKQYKNVEFRYIKRNKINYKLLRLIYGPMRKFIKNKIGDEYIRLVIRDLKTKKEINKYDKIVILNNINNIIYISKKIKGKHILHLHNDYLNVDVKNCKNILKSLDEVWCVSGYIKSRVDKIADNSKTVLLYNGINFNEFSKNVSQKKIDDIRRKYDILDDDFIILYTGRLMPEKGIKELINSYKKVEKIKKNIKLIIIGGPTNISLEFVENLKKECNEYKEKIIFVGNSSHDVINVFYKIANVQVIPSMWNEAFGLTVTEGMFAGVPLIVSDSGGIPEIVGDECALIVKRENIIEELADAIIKVYENNDNFCEKMVKKSQERVKSFSMDKYLENMKDLLLKDIK